MPGLDITTTLADQTATIAVVGEVDIATAPQFRDAVAAAIDTFPRTVIDLTAAGYFDSSGLRVLFQFADRIAEVTVPDEGVACPSGDGVGPGPGAARTAGLARPGRTRGWRSVVDRIRDAFGFGDQTDKPDNAHRGRASRRRRRTRSPVALLPTPGRG